MNYFTFNDIRNTTISLRLFFSARVNYKDCYLKIELQDYVIDVPYKSKQALTKDYNEFKKFINKDKIDFIEKLKDKNNLIVTLSEKIRKRDDVISILLGQLGGGIGDTVVKAEIERMLK